MKITARIENQLDPTNSSIYQNVNDRRNHIYKITCKDQNIDPKTKFAIKQWLKQEEKDHTSLMHNNEGIFFVKFQVEAKDLE